MKKFALTMLVAAAAACNGSDTNDNPSAPSAGELEACTGTGQGNCASGLLCVDWTQIDPGLQGAASCMTPCDPSGSTSCPEGETCDPDFGLCLTNGGKLGQSCLLDGTGCAEGLTCEQLDPDVAALACTQACDWSAVNTGAAGCPQLPGGVQTECLGADFVEVQHASGGDDQTCTIEGSAAAPCDGGDGYSCGFVGSGGGAPSLKCNRQAARCGVPVAATPSFSAAYLAGSDHDENLCGLPGYADLACKPAGTASARCSESGYVDVQKEMSGETPTGCSSDADCAPGNECLAFSGGKYCAVACSDSGDCDYATGYACLDLSTGSFCAYPISYCIDFCDEDGQTCGEGATCRRVAVDCAPNDTSCLATGNGELFPFPEEQVGEDGRAVACTTDTDCDHSAADPADYFKCYDLSAYGGGKFCGRPHKVCVAD